MPGVAGRSGGRNAKTTQEHELLGTHREHRHGGSETPDPPKGRPEPPLPLEGLACDEWAAVCDDLESQGVLALTDRMAIYQYARLFAETESHAVSRMECSETVRILEENIGDKSLKGPDLVAAFQEITKMRKLELSHATATRQGRMALRQWLVEFGLTPAARSRVKVAKPETPGDGWDDIIN